MRDDGEEEGEREEDGGTGREGKVRQGQYGSSQPVNGVPTTEFNWRW